MYSVFKFIENDLDLKNNENIIVAVSGGPDSMALLDLLHKIKKNINIICAHVNHNTGRLGQIEEQEYVEKFCLENKITCETMIIEEYGDDNFENEARDKRYNFFEKLIKKYNARYLFTAHHGDDLIETILMRISRGSTIKGYSGFSKISKRDNYSIVRPFIELTKDEIIEYNKENNIKYYIDSTNLEDIHTRNRYRKYILPQLKNEDKNIHKKFYKFSNMLLEYNQYIENKIESILPNIFDEKKISIVELKKQDLFVCKKIINYILEHIYQDDLFLITDQHVNLIYKLIFSKKVNTFIYLPNNIKVRKTYNYLSFIKEDLEKLNYEIEIIDRVFLPNGKTIEVLSTSNQTDNYICRLNKNDVQFPLRVRTRKDGDKIEIKGLNGSKKISDVFIDSKIAMNDRNLWPIVVDSNDKIVWLPGLKKSKFDKQKNEKCDIILRYY